MSSAPTQSETAEPVAPASDEPGTTAVEQAAQEADQQVDGGEADDASLLEAIGKVMEGTVDTKPEPAEPEAQEPEESSEPEAGEPAEPAEPTVPTDDGFDVQLLQAAQLAGLTPEQARTFPTSQHLEGYLHGVSRTTAGRPEDAPPTPVVPQTPRALQEAIGKRNFAFDFKPGAPLEEYDDATRAVVKGLGEFTEHQNMRASELEVGMLHFAGVIRQMQAQLASVLGSSAQAQDNALLSALGEEYAPYVNDPAVVAQIIEERNTRAMGLAGQGKTAPPDKLIKDAADFVLRDKHAERAAANHKKKVDRRKGAQSPPPTTRKATDGKGGEDQLLDAIQAVMDR